MLSTLGRAAAKKLLLVQPTLSLPLPRQHHKECLCLLLLTYLHDALLRAIYP